MPNFLWTAKDKFGKSIVREIAAETIEESKAILLAEGCTNLESKSDEIMDLANSRSSELPKKTPEQKLKYFNNPTNTFSKLILKITTQGLWFHLLIILVLIFAVYQGYKATAMIIGMGWIGGIAAMIWLGLPHIYYARMNKAKDWHRWHKVSELADKLERMQPYLFTKILPLELPRIRAQIFAGLGKLPEAIAEFQQCENHHGMPNRLYNTHLAEICSIAKDYDKRAFCFFPSRKTGDRNKKTTRTPSSL